ncbi:MAG: S26 family signal peptidase [Candidatus Kapaibacterium sp.]
MNVSIEHLFPVIKKSLDEGKCVRFISTGGSMMPFIYNDDEVKMMPFNKYIRKGDIVLLKASDKFILHRVVRLDLNKFYIRGDAQNASEGPYSYENVIGVVSESVHKGRTRNHREGFWRFASAAWRAGFPISLFYFNFYKSLRRLLGKILRGLKILPPANRK